MTRKGYTATCIPDKRELQRMRRWDRQSGKAHIDHGKESLRRAVMRELREFPR
ncbi:hypothetical protein SPSPH_045500 [Sporomusa sphaeroides DSM 2875]|uniref:Uncharacterized protein n=1 Tax=Sporomusa sphaeroides DSM 2875 TaxID=1337886 RepID=A0ABM9W0J7_9FIRM|nr:hypothetical protein SPSPH_27760 [Sporomusa sphaeroides DSM 2875]CVK18478.1 hypothetical protein SSPH_01116 [Sporomusa sphaeroides DSM 2875]